MNIMRKERGQYPDVDVAYRPTPCMHCDSAPCVKAAKNGAVYKREDGIVIIDPEKAEGEEALLKACPYGAIWWNPENNTPQKCTLCAHLLERGQTPACVAACEGTGANALHVGDLNDPYSNVSKLIAGNPVKRIRPDLGTEPKVHYIGL